MKMKWNWDDENFAYLFWIHISDCTLDHELVLFRLFIGHIAEHKRDLTCSWHSWWNDSLNWFDHKLFRCCRFYLVGDVTRAVNVLNFEQGFGCSTNLISGQNQHVFRLSQIYLKKSRTKNEIVKKVITYSSSVEVMFFCRFLKFIKLMSSNQLYMIINVISVIFM